MTNAIGNNKQQPTCLQSKTSKSRRGISWWFALVGHSWLVRARRLQESSDAKYELLLQYRPDALQKRNVRVGLQKKIEQVVRNVMLWSFCGIS